ncbi:MAG: preprotein translocase subunit SecG [Acidobacteriia bacterium]|nr:preprotein translocase subunit SecG [Terriglobia bacterium]
MIYFITFIHIVVCVVLVAVVLLQSGKAADLAGAFGGMGSQTVFGPRGSATVLSKATTISAVLFMLTSLTLSILATRGGSATPDLLKKAIPPAGQTAPAQSKAPAPGGTVPITVQSGPVGGQQSAPQTVPVPVAPAPATPPPAAPSPQK